jgi:hypothetical protein
MPAELVPRRARKPLSVAVPGHGVMTVWQIGKLTGRVDATIRRRIQRGVDPLTPGDLRHGNPGGTHGRPAGFVPITTHGGGTMFIAMRLVLVFGQRLPSRNQLAAVLPGMNRATLYRWRRALQGRHVVTRHNFGMQGSVEIARRWSHPIPALSDWPLLVADVNCGRATAYRLIRAMRDAAGLP